MFFSMAIAMVASMGASIAFAADEVRLRLNWMYYGSHAGFAYGITKLQESIWTSVLEMVHHQHTA